MKGPICISAYVHVPIYVSNRCRFFLPINSIPIKMFNKALKSENWLALKHNLSFVDVMEIDLNGPIRMCMCIDCWPLFDPLLV